MPKPKPKPKPKTPGQPGQQNRRKSPVWKLRLYVAGQTPKSIRAFANLKTLCEEHLKGSYRLEVIDLLEQPQLAQRRPDRSDSAQKNCRGEIRLRSQEGTPLPVQLSLNPLHVDGIRAVCLIASDLSVMKRAEQELRASAEQLRNLAASLLSVREEERARIAREIHDELGQSLTSVKMDLAWVAGRLPRRNGRMLEKIRSTLQLADGLIQSVRRISTELRPGILDLGLSAAVEWQAQEFQARTGIQCKLRLLAQEEFAPDVSTALFRIFQEALTNVARHARATRVEVVKQKERDRLVLRIRDNGRGFDPADPSLSKSLGLLGMRERAAILGGRVNISSAPGKGTSVTVWIPLRLPEESGAMP